MRISDFPLIFNDEEFPIRWEKEYIRLLTTFEVAVELGNGELLIPSHLHPRRPNLPQTMFPEDLVSVVSSSSYGDIILLKYKKSGIISGWITAWYLFKVDSSHRHSSTCYRKCCPHCDTAMWYHSFQVVSGLDSYPDCSQTQPLSTLLWKDVDLGKMVSFFVSRQNVGNSIIHNCSSYAFLNFK